MKYPQIFDLLNQFHPIPAEIWQQVEGAITPLSLRKGDFLVSEGDSSNKVGFVASGLCRTYYLNAEGKEYTKFFQGPGVFAAPYAELILDIPARCHIQAVVDSELFIFPYSDFRVLLDSDPNWQVLGRKLAEHFFIEKDQREYELLQLSAEQRYEAFMERYNDIAESIPQYQVASYLGITAVALSRILGRKKSSD